MKRIRTIRRNTFPKFNVVDARKIPGGIEVKIEYPGNTTITSPWMKMDSRYYWVNDKKFKIKSITDVLCDRLIGSDVRVPKIEKEHKISIRKQQNAIYRRNRI